MAIQLRIQLANVSKPPVWRRVLVPDSYNFHQLHLVIQEAFEWGNYHLFQFEKQAFSNDWCISYEEDVLGLKSDNLSPDKVNVRQFIEQNSLKKFVYVYDFGDNWTHKIEVEELDNDKIKHPVCLAGKGCTPPEDCGGPWGYEHIKSLLGRDDLDENEQEELDFWGEDFDIYDFDIDYINEQFAIFNKRYKSSKKQAQQAEDEREDDISFEEFMDACLPTDQEMKDMEKRKKKFQKFFIVPDDITPNIERIKKYRAVMNRISALSQEIKNLPKTQKKKEEQLNNEIMQQTDEFTLYICSDDYLTDKELYNRGLLPKDTDTSLFTQEGLMKICVDLFGNN